MIHVLLPKPLFYAFLASVQGGVLIVHLFLAEGANHLKHNSMLDVFYLSLVKRRVESLRGSFTGISFCDRFSNNFFG